MELSSAADAADETLARGGTTGPLHGLPIARNEDRP
jgi:Asp-tRNA(Asn)/Glu-tRNA(Gln) amidotransferase A subunit family amidase